MSDHQDAFWEKLMDATSSSRFISAVPQSQSSLASLPDELILQIVLRIRDTTTLRSLWQTCTHFASLNLAPAFVSTMTDQFFTEQSALLRTLAKSDRLPRIHQLARKMAKDLKLAHAKQMMECLDSPDENDAGGTNADPAATAGVRDRLASFLMSTIMAQQPWQSSQTGAKSSMNS